MKSGDTMTESDDNQDQPDDEGEGESLKEMFKAEREELSELKESVNELTDVLKQPLEESQNSDGPTQLSENEQEEASMDPEGRDYEDGDEINVKESIQEFQSNFTKIGEILENLHERLEKVEGNYADDDMEDEEGDYEDDDMKDEEADKSDSQSPEEAGDGMDSGDDTSDDDDDEDEDEEEPQPPQKGENLTETFSGNARHGDSDIQDAMKDVL